MSGKGLVILGSSITALAIARNARALGVKPTIVDLEAGIATLTARARVHMVSSLAAADTLDQIITLGGPSSSLIATSDPWVEFVAEHETVLRAGYRAVLHPNANVLRSCLSKLEFAHWCRTSGVPAPEFVAGDELEAVRDRGLRFPMILRPAMTLHHEANPAVPKAIEIHSEAELDAWLSTYQAHGIQPFLSQSLLGRPLTQYSVGVARRDHQLVSLVSRKLRPAPEQCRVGTFVATCSAPLVESLGKRVADRLDIQGIAEIEILHAHDTGADFVIEVNPRPWLQYSLVRASGRDFLRFLLQEEIPADEGGDTSTHYWLNFRGDLYNCFSRSGGLVRTGRVGPGEYLASILRTDAYANFAIGDPRPAISEFMTTVRSLARK